MKKTLLVICTVFLIIMLILFWNFRQVQAENRLIQKFNYEYEFYNREGICGIDITTVINKATDNNEKCEVKKDENGYYIPNDEDSINIDIKLINNDKTYRMEKIKEVGLEGFVEFFGEVEFKCTNIEYHEKTGKISKMTFESLQK
ncbi:MAG: hypothetical protein K1W33_03450 [Clostridia bacterium]